MEVHGGILSAIITFQRFSFFEEESVIYVSHRHLSRITKLHIHLVM